MLHFPLVLTQARYKAKLNKISVHCPGFFQKKEEDEGLLIVFISFFQRWPPHILSQAVVSPVQSHHVVFVFVVVLKRVVSIMRTTQKISLFEKKKRKKCGLNKKDEGGDDQLKVFLGPNRSYK